MGMARRWAGMVAVLGLVAALALSGRARLATAQTADITISDFAFTPATITVPVGGTVIWTNDDAEEHTTTARAGGWDSGAIAPGATYGFIIRTPGTFAYGCSIHPSMEGTLVVQEQPAPAPVPTTAPSLPPAPTSTATPSSGAIPSAAIVARDFSFSAPASVPAGPVVLRLTNAGNEPHHAQLFRLPDGVDAELYQQVAATDPRIALAIVRTAGGPGTVAPGGAQEVVQDLEAGNYVFVCLVESADGQSHLAQGMIAPLTVTAGAPAPRPVTDLTATLRDFSFALPASLPARPVTVAVSNEGAQAHEWGILRLTAGASAETVIAFLREPTDGPPPFAPAGGIQAFDAGVTGWLNLDLPAGSYLAICFVPDLASGQPHFALGMTAPFTVE